ncbi:MAG TPA: LLM class flavin-dependent oxidoreductase, partial [Xanthobacteraceae bacterium]|nr:LLM class flavin-dependent oxidoreductase [Xanthobacteraceae bacterium]
QLVEEIGMLDHLTGGRLEIGTAAGIPNEMDKIGLGVDEARARNDEALEIIDKALAAPVISHHGKFWNFDNLRLTPRPVQQPSPPIWVTVVSVSSARKAARRGAKICTGFHPHSKVIEIFDAYRDEADKAGRKVGPDDLCIRRQLTMLDKDSDATDALAAQRKNFRQFIQIDPRVDLPGRPAVLDTPTAHAFSIGDEEFIAGTPATVAEVIAAQCKSAGAGHFAAIFNRSASPETLRKWYADFGQGTIPLLRKATV